MDRLMTVNNTGAPNLKSYGKVRGDRNILVLYRLAGNYHKVQQRFKARFAEGPQNGK